jgi:spore coat polysaccharide biosynthesis protein SpsF
MLKIGIITQARMTSTRLPAKVFKEAGGKSLLLHHIDRLRKTGFEIRIATTTNASDDCICDFAKTNKLSFYRGSEHNVLERFYETASEYKLDIIIRVTSDCPLIDPHLIRNSVEKYLKLNNDLLYMSNSIERTFARGFDFEIFSFRLLEDAFQNATEESDLEHVTPYIWKNKNGKTELFHVKQAIDNSDLRITVDTADDLLLIQRLIEDYNAATLSYVEIENTLRSHPELVSINSHIEQKKI